MLVMSACQQEKNDVQTLAFITSEASDFWDKASRGVRSADGELEQFEVEFRIPGGGSALEQRRIFEDLLARGVAGIAICPIDPDNAKKWLNKGAGKTLLITVGSDAPDSNRMMYIGTDNKKAGITAGVKMRELLAASPDQKNADITGKVVLFAGSKDNADVKERLEGIRIAFEPTQIEIVNILTDGGDRLRAIGNVEDALVKHKDVTGVMGLSSYNGPAIYQALRNVAVEKRVKVVCFDSEPGTLNGLKRDVIDATIVQQPWQFGNEAIKVMAEYIGGNTRVIPTKGAKTFKTDIITKAEVWDYEVYGQ